jgi:hypothetical protein
LNYFFSHTQDIKLSSLYNDSQQSCSSERKFGKEEKNQLTTDTVFLPNLFPNATLPAAIATIEWSLPNFTPVPGLNFVPLWRTRIEPMVTTSPCPVFGPKYLGFGRLCWRVFPAAFFFDIRLFKYYTTYFSQLSSYQYDIV